MTMLLIVLGLIIAFILVYNISNKVIRKNKTNADELQNSWQVTINVDIPVPRFKTVKEEDKIIKLASFFTDEMQDPIQSKSTFILTFQHRSNKMYKIYGSALGWNWFGEPANCRKIKNIEELGPFFESLLPSIKDSDLDKIPIPYENLYWFDRMKIPENLQELIPLAKKFGMGDDLYRSEIVRRSRNEEKKELIAKVKEKEEEEIYSLLDSFPDSTEMPEEVIRFMYLLEAYREIE